MRHTQPPFLRHKVDGKSFESCKYVGSKPVVAGDRLAFLIEHSFRAHSAKNTHNTLLIYIYILYCCTELHNTRSISNPIQPYPHTKNPTFFIKDLRKYRHLARPPSSLHWRAAYLDWRCRNMACGSIEGSVFGMEWSKQLVLPHGWHTISYIMNI